MGHTVPWIQCPCGKRGFEDEHDAEKALGRAQTKRNRIFDRSAASRRGMKRESRFYECDSGLFHLTEQSRKVFQSYTFASAVRSPKSIRARH